jgi:hypothetical protein
MTAEAPMTFQTHHKNKLNATDVNIAFVIAIQKDELCGKCILYLLQAWCADATFKTPQTLP